MCHYRERRDPVPARLLMSRRPAVLLTFPRLISDSSLFCVFCSLVQKSEAHPLPFQSLARSLQKRRRACPPAQVINNVFRSRNSHLSFNKSFRINTYTKYEGGSTAQRLRNSSNPAIKPALHHLEDS